MNTTLDFIVTTYRLDLAAPAPIEIPNVGRNTLAQWLHELDFKTGVEVGVAAGEYSKILCAANPQMQLCGIDPWKPYRGYRDYTRNTTFTTLYNDAHERLSRCPNYTFIEKFSTDAMPEFADDSLDFVYIDANHQEPYISEDIAGWHKKVRAGGILAGHDYLKGRRFYDVAQAVTNFTQARGIKPWFVLGTFAKIPGMIRDYSRSWLWVKE